MAYEPDNHAPTKARELDYLVKALGIDELFKRVHELDDKGDLPKAADWNPTGDPMVQRNFYGEVGSLSSGPNEENVGRLDVIDPDHVRRLKALAEQQKADAELRAEREEAEKAERAEAEEADSEQDEKSKDEEKSQQKAETKPETVETKPETKVSTPSSRTSASKK